MITLKFHQKRADVMTKPADFHAGRLKSKPVQKIISELRMTSNGEN